MASKDIYTLSDIFWQKYASLKQNNILTCFS